MRKTLITAVLLLSFVTILMSGANANQTYVVQPKDTLWKIAKQFNVAQDELLKANNLTEPNDIKLGQTLVIPTKSTPVKVAPAKINPVTPSKVIAPTKLETNYGKKKTTLTSRSGNVLTLHGSRRYSSHYRSKTYSPSAYTRKIVKKDQHGNTVMILVGRKHEPPPVIAQVPRTVTPKNYPRSLASRGQFTNSNIVKSALHYLGVPYRWGGTKPSGFDCSGFVQSVYRLNGISILRTADVQFAQGIPITIEQLQPGDLVFFTTYTSGASHVGIYVGNMQFIHASSAGGVVRINSLEESYYRQRFIGARRYIQ